MSAGTVLVANDVRLGSGTWDAAGNVDVLGPITVFSAGELLLLDASVNTTAIDLQGGLLGGTGTINGAGEYKFMLTAIDGSPDKFRIKIWDKGTDQVVYDNQMTAAEDADPTTSGKRSKAYGSSGLRRLMRQYRPG